MWNELAPRLPTGTWIIRQSKEKTGLFLMMEVVCEPEDGSDSGTIKCMKIKVLNSGFQFVGKANEPVFPTIDDLVKMSGAECPFSHFKQKQLKMLKQVEKHSNFMNDPKLYRETLAEISRLSGQIQRSNRASKSKKILDLPFPVNTWLLRQSSKGDQFATITYLKDPTLKGHISIEVLYNGFRREGFDDIFGSIDELTTNINILGPPLSGVLEGFRVRCMDQQPAYKLSLEEAYVSEFGCEMTNKKLFEMLKKMWVKTKNEEMIPFYYDENADQIFLHMSKRQLKGCGSADPTFAKIFYNNHVFHTILDGYPSDLDLTFNQSHQSRELRTKMLVLEANWKISQMEPNYAILSRPAEATPEETLRHWLVNENVDGIFIGEVHDDQASKHLLIENMGQLKEAGVETLFMEFVHYDGGQKALDAYFHSADPDRDIPPEISSLLKEHDAKYGFPRRNAPGLLDLVRAAKLHGIRVVGVESEATEEAGFYKFVGAKGADRIAALNYNAKKIIEKEKGNGKFLALMGTLHVVKSDNVLGMSQMMGLPSMIVFDDRTLVDKDIKKEKKIPTGFDLIPFEKFQSNAHAVFSIPPHPQRMAQITEMNDPRKRS